MSLAHKCQVQQLSKSKARLEPLTLIAFLLLVTMLLSVMGGCVIGVKERVTYASLTTFPEESNGTFIIATNKKIPVTIGGTNVATEQDLGGYAAIHLRDLKFLVETVDKNIELEKQLKELKNKLDK